VPFRSIEQPADAVVVPKGCGATMSGWLNMSAFPSQPHLRGWQKESFRPAAPQSRRDSGRWVMMIARRFHQHDFRQVFQAKRAKVAFIVGAHMVHARRQIPERRSRGQKRPHLRCGLLERRKLFAEEKMR